MPLSAEVAAVTVTPGGAGDGDAGVDGHCAEGLAVGGEGGVDREGGLRAQGKGEDADGGEGSGEAREAEHGMNERGKGGESGERERLRGTRTMRGGEWRGRT